MVNVKTTNEIADGGDYLKVFACTAVMLQSVLGLAWSLPSVTAHQSGLAVLYLLTKFTAPAFICGILLTTMRTTAEHQPTYRHYLHNQWSALFFPTICWTLAYLLVFPNLQQHEHFHDWLSWGWQFVNGNAAPHLWYNTMMLQIVILMPVLWFIRHKLMARWTSGWILGITGLGYALWVGWYVMRVYPTSRYMSWYLLDRMCWGFWPYAILGMLAWHGWPVIQYRLRRWSWGLGLLWGLALLAQCGAWFAEGWPIQLSQTSYYLPATIVYVLTVIGLVLALAGRQQARRSRFLPVIHRLAQYAYPSYLANVFWLQIIWRLGGATLTRFHPIWGIALCYSLTWCWSFGFTALLERFKNWRRQR